MYILGISGSVVGHDASSALVCDGRIVEAMEEERLSREKHRAGVWPNKTALALLSLCPGGEDDIEEVAYYWGMRDLWKMVFSTLGYLEWGRVRECLRAMRNKFVVGSSVKDGPAIFMGYVMNRRPLPRIRLVDHHLAHAASAHLVSPFETSATAVLDGAGEYACSSFYQWEGNRPRFLGNIAFPHSLGYVYASITEYLGFHCLADEWKVMGLAPYGRPDARLKAFFEEMLILEPEGRYRVDPRFVLWPLDFLRDPLLHPRAWERLGGPPRRGGEELTMRHQDVAFALQARVEEAIFHVLRHLQKRTGEKRLTLAGGVALNCKANGKVLQETDFEEIYVQPAAHDGGGALGAALFAWQARQGYQGERHVMRGAYLGPSFSDEEIRAELVKSKLHFRELDDPSDTAADLLADGRIVGWYQGRMEWGPRALGNRSILADPRDASMKDRINAAVKFREGFRPFAPAILAEEVGEWFVETTPSPFMTLTSNIRPEKQEELGAVCHADGTGRLQTVEKEVNPLFHRLIERFGNRTGVPVVLNTSFNVKGEPIVCTPQEAIRCFCGTGIDALIIGRFLLRKNALDQPQDQEAEIAASGLR